ncbi:MAG: hypothetical protein GY833_16420 [Aestuariibacter sp.]|nr:hypothetical protein [Aestuariibacter sp.]
MPMNLTAVLFIAREAGIEVFDYCIRENIKVITVYTHPYEPQVSANAELRERREYKAIADRCHKYGIPLHAVPPKDIPDCRYVIACSWRNHISRRIREKATLGAINLHRGRLPQYAGAEPVKRAIQDKAEHLYVTAHHLEEGIDTGATICSVRRPLRHVPICNIDSLVVVEKRKLLPMYSRALRAAIDITSDDFIYGKGLPV